MATSTRPRLGDRVRRRPVAAYLALALTSSYLLLSVMVLVERDVLPGRDLPDIVGAGMEEAASLVLVLVLVSSALIITHLEEYDYVGATAIAAVMLIISFCILLFLNGLQVWQRRRGA